MSGRRDTELAEQVAILTRQGLSVAAIARRLFVSSRTVERYRSAVGVARPKAVPFTAEELEWAQQMLTDGCSYTEVGRTLGRDPQRISRRFPGYGFTPAQSVSWRWAQAVLETL